MSSSSSSTDQTHKMDSNIESKSFETIIFEKKEVKTLESESDCLICMEGLENKQRVLKMVCGHYFHYKCMTQWLKKKSTCPKCRQQVTDNPFLTESSEENVVLESPILNDTPPSSLTLSDTQEAQRGVPHQDLLESIMEYERSIRQYISNSDSEDELTED